MDFVNFDKRLSLEIDGGQHAEASDYDGARDAWLANEGYRVLRFWKTTFLQICRGGSRPS
jgi:very-short-patch-repair endonuclease